jgi:hypothetical protein
MARTCRIGPPRPTSLQGRAKKAKSPQGDRFRHRYGRRDEDVLPQCWRDIRKEAAAGVEQVRAQAYEQPLDEHRHRLVERLQQQRYRATLVRRHDSPTGAGTPRPLGIPRTGAVRRQDTEHRVQSAPTGRKTERRVAGVRGSVGPGSPGARAPPPPDRPDETPGLAHALHRVGSGAPPPPAASTVPAAQRQTPWVLPRRRRPGARRQPASVLHHSQTAFAAVAQSASPTPP